MKHVVAALVIIFLAWQMFNIYQTHQPDVTTNWVPTLAKVISARNVGIWVKGANNNRPSIIYNYKVKGTEYSCGQYSVPDPPPMRAESCTKILAQFPVGSDVTAYYNPKDPSEACLTTHVNREGGSGLGWGLGPLLFVGIFILAGIFMRSNKLMSR